MPLFKRWRQEAKAIPSEPVRLTKVLAIVNETKARVAVACPEAAIPTSRAPLELYARTLKLKDLHIAVPECTLLLGPIRAAGREACRKMVNRPLAFVTSFNVVNDPDWPT